VVVELGGVTKHFRDVRAVSDVDVAVRDGELLAVLGPVGCGKTTLLRLIAGLETPSEGVVRIDGETVTNVPPYERQTGMVFQQCALFPHMTVADNVAFGLEMRGTPDVEIRQRVLDALAAVRLDGQGGRVPSSLTNRERRRAALARALAIEPSVLLVDEPEPGTAESDRAAHQRDLLRVREELDVPVVYVTTEREEALTMGDRIAVMEDGVVRQVAPPEDVYHEPADEFVADFVGGANLLTGTVEAVGPRGYTVDLDFGETIVLSAPREAEANVREGQTVTLLFRPERLYLHPRDDVGDADNRFDGVVVDATFLGSQVEYTVDVGGEQLVVVQQRLEGSDRYGEGDRVAITFGRGSPFAVPGGGV
jgi:ABC-type Fe3+/spermidine/putrescine transport system ATPase subunit